MILQVENDLQELRGDLKTWLTIQAEEKADADPEDNPFAYAIGQSQTRFGDDFDHERMARYDVSIAQCLDSVDVRFNKVCIYCFLAEPIVHVSFLLNEFFI